MPLFRRSQPGFRDRTDAGQRLAAKLGDLKGRDDVLVLALPRGGVPVGFEVANALRAPLGAFLVRKLGAPGNPELALGALAGDGTLVVDRALLADLGVSDAYLAEELARQRCQLKSQATGLEPWLTLPDLTRRTLVLVDDGVATGSTVRAGLQALRTKRPRQLVVAVPVGQPGVLAQLATMADRVEAVLAPERVYGVGAWYQDFRQTSEAEVIQLLKTVTTPYRPTADAA